MKRYRSEEMKTAYEKGGYRERYAMDNGNKTVVYINNHKCYKFTYSQYAEYQDANGSTYDTVTKNWIDQKGKVISMFEKYRDAEQLSCKNVLDGRYISKNDGWKDMEDEDDRYELFKLFREYVADTARGKRKQRILNASMNYVEACGILNRLYYSFERERVEYCCGQEWHSEMAILRDCFDK